MDYEVLGLMSGTSLDGVDLAHVKFRLEDGQWSYHILHAQTYSYPKEWIQKLRFRPDFSALDLLELDHDYGNYLGRNCQLFMDEHSINPTQLLLVASHGHTLFHQPEKGYTLQIGNGAELFAALGIPVVCNFRAQDVALGGQGAPLVPIGDQLLFNQYDACLNLGGFANISFEENGKRSAFDICPVNFILNPEAQKLGRPYDDQGSLARAGDPNEELLSRLAQLPYYQQPPPKSLGAEWVNQQFLPMAGKALPAPQETLASYAHHIAKQITKTLQKHQLENILVTGGGAYNHYLIELIRKDSKSNLILPNPEVIEFKEALIFALMGILKWKGENNVLASVTGAQKDHSAGVIYS